MSNIYLVADVAMLAGVIALRSGAETYRVEETIEKIALSQGMRKVEVFATPTGIFLFIEDKERFGYSKIERVKGIGIDLNKVVQINDISRQMVEGKLSIEKAQELLRSVDENNKAYNFWLYVLGGGIAGGSFAYLFGGQLREVILAFVAGIIIQMVIEQPILRPSRFFVSFAGGAIAALIAVVGSLFINKLNIDNVIIGAIMTLVPGVAITNSIRDVLHQDYISGAARGLEAFLIALSIAAGVTLILGTRLILRGGF